MKLILLILSFLLLAIQPAHAVVMVGFGQSAAPSGISDDFSSDTSANYTAITGTINIASGTIGGGTNWQHNYFYHETSTGSDNHYVQGYVATSVNALAGGTVGLRCNSATGYLLHLVSANDRVYLNRFNGATVSIGSYLTSASDLGTGSYNVKVTVSGSTFHIYVDHNGDGDFLDTNEDLGTITDSTYSTGEYIVVGASRGTDGVDYRVDNLSGGSL